MERLNNGQEDQQRRRRAAAADASASTTPAFSQRLTGSQSSPKTLESCSYEPTPNGDHDNGSQNGSTAPATTRERTQGLQTAFDLRTSVYPLPRRPARPKRRQVLPHFGEVVKFVHESRYATRSQIQRRFPAAMPSDRTAQYQLQSLVALGHLERAVIRGHAPDDYPVYFATRRGLQLVDQSDAASLPAKRTATEQTRSNGVSDQFMLHELLITESDLLDWLTIQRSAHLQRLFVQRRYFRDDQVLRYEVDGKTHRIKPDSGSLIQSVHTPGQPPTALMHFKEIDKGTMPLARLIAKFQAWDNWAHSQESRTYLRDLYTAHGFHYRRPTFRLLVIAHANSRQPGDDHARLVTLFAAALSVSPSLRRRIWLTTAADLQQHQHDPLPSSAPIWQRVRDAQPWCSEYRQIARQLSRARRHRPNSWKHRFVAQRRPSLPKHQVFAL